ncbi:MAG TPA: glycoside hydrolase family 43 protein [Candidatus Didemnitutus sp.]|nr:glycoside hydrolase family 43 protein [Candidatus Didemnitutus sp.]
MRRRASTFLLLAVVAIVRALAAEWPLTGALNAHDPTLIKDGETWWCFSTGPGVRTKRSTDGLEWKQGESLLKEERAWWREYAPAKRALDVWAPDLQRFRDRIWCFYCVSEFGRNNSAIGLVSCTSIAHGDWRDDGFVIGSKSGVDASNAIDPFLAIDAGGEPWLVFGSWFDGIQLVKLDAATMKPVGKVSAVARRSGGIEAPNLIYANGWYYLFVSIDKCCAGVNSTYKIAYGRSKDIVGPYFDKAGRSMLDAGGTVLEAGAGRWIGPGGQDIYQDGERWILVRHAYDAENNGRPALRIRDLYWDAAGWPTMAGPGSKL